MKTIHLLRHAHAGFSSEDNSDFNRCLSEQGISEIQSLACKISNQQLSPDLILASSAQRTRQTTKILMESCNWHGRVQFLDIIYEADIQDLLELIHNQPDNCNNLLICGHNPTISYLSSYILNSRISIDTANYISFELNIEKWIEITKGIGELKLHLLP
ncbi:MAG: hypothetical protein C0594_13290 [Marinilabiliales bacterium]|mgnify:CR=1 FL=1|nr:MAG: hypothetical protein C0594_13290 [Marinilabiliales bacterium]